jgi:hypothetical protein
LTEVARGCPTLPAFCAGGWGLRDSLRRCCHKSRFRGRTSRGTCARVGISNDPTSRKTAASSSAHNDQQSRVLDCPNSIAAIRLSRLVVPSPSNAARLRRDDFEKYSSCSRVGPRDCVLPLEVQSARTMGVRWSSAGILLAHLAGAQSFSSVLLHWELRIA